jgi:hypothetical protein
VKVERRRKLTAREWAAITSSRPVLRWVLVRRPITERSGVSETPTYEDVLHALKVRLAGSPQLRYQPAEDIGHDLMTNGYLSTQPDPALVRRALAEIGDDGGAP